MMNTDRKPIPGFEGRYSLTQDGQVISEAREVPTGFGTRPVAERVLKRHWYAWYNGRQGYTIALRYKGRLRRLWIDDLMAQLWPVS